LQLPLLQLPLTPFAAPPFAAPFAALAYIEANLQKGDVIDAIQWISQSYKSHLPLDEPNDENGQFTGGLVESMNFRRVENAEELRNPKVPSQHRK
jgi:hypothetical protein